MKLFKEMKAALLQWYRQDFTVDSVPSGLAFDGANIWVANFIDNNATKLRVSVGVSLETFPAGNNPVSVAFDGANVWVTNNGGSSGVSKGDGFPVATGNSEVTKRGLERCSRGMPFRQLQ